MKLHSPIKRRHTRIEIIPLIDIMFFLLASFMMVSLQLESTKNIKVTLPNSNMGRPDFKPGMLSIAVDKAGQVWLEKTSVSLAQLSQALTNRFHIDTNLPVCISGDSATPHGAMCDVLDAVRRAGVQKVAFMVEGGTNGAAQ